MEYLKQKQVLRRRLYGKTVKIVLLVVIAFLIKPTWNIYKKSQESEQNLARAKEELAELEKREKELSAVLKSLQSEEGIDEEIREKFGVAKPGESVVVIVEEKEDSEEKIVENPPGFLKRTWSRFVGWFGVE